jgi:formyltetrahydrofolate synthetase
MNWKDKLTPEEIEHLRAQGIDTLKKFKEIREYQVNLVTEVNSTIKAVGSKLEPINTLCRVCDGIAVKLGVK